MFIGNPSQFSNPGNNSIGIDPNTAARALSDPQMREVALGQIATALIVKAVLSFDDPITTQSGASGNSGTGGTQNRTSNVQNAPGYNGSTSLGSSFRPADNERTGSLNMTQQGGLSLGGGFRVGGGGGFSAAGSTTLNSSGYQTSGGISGFGLSGNAGLKINGGGIQFSGGIQRAQVGQGLVGDKVGPALVGPRIVGP